MQNTVVITGSSPVGACTQTTKVGACNYWSLCGGNQIVVCGSPVHPLINVDTPEGSVSGADETQYTYPWNENQQ